LIVPAWVIWRTVFQPTFEGLFLPKRRQKQPIKGRSECWSLRWGYNTYPSDVICLTYFPENTLFYWSYTIVKADSKGVSPGADLLGVFFSPQ
jgi:hypothetical protein